MCRIPRKMFCQKIQSKSLLIINNTTFENFPIIIYHRNNGAVTLTVTLRGVETPQVPILKFFLKIPTPSFFTKFLRITHFNPKPSHQRGGVNCTLTNYFNLLYKIIGTIFWLIKKPKVFYCCLDPLPNSLWFPLTKIFQFPRVPSLVFSTPSKSKTR